MNDLRKIEVFRDKERNDEPFTATERRQFRALLKKYSYLIFSRHDAGIIEKGARD